MGIFNRTVQCWESWVHILKASKDSGSDDAQEQPNDVEDGGRPEQVVEVDDILAAADIDVLVVPTSDLHTECVWQQRLHQLWHNKRLQSHQS